MSGPPRRARPCDGWPRFTFRPEAQMNTTRSGAWVGALTFALLLAGATPALAQQGTVAGRVTEAAGGTPIPAAQVSIVGTNLGGLTDADGRHQIRGAPASPTIRSTSSTASG